MLIKACEKEKEIISTGLFIDEMCQQYNKHFPAHKYDSTTYYVYLNHGLKNLHSAGGSYNKFPFGICLWEYMETCGVEWELALDILMLKQIFNNMINHDDPKVRVKHLTN